MATGLGPRAGYVGTNRAHPTERCRWLTPTHARRGRPACKPAAHFAVRSTGTFPDRPDDALDGGVGGAGRGGRQPADNPEAMARRPTASVGHSGPSVAPPTPSQPYPQFRPGGPGSGRVAAHT